MAARSHRRVYNELISHCKGGQGGRTFSKMKGTNTNKGSESMAMRAKTQLQPTGKHKFKPGYYKYIPIDVERDASGKPIDWPKEESCK